MREFSFEKNLFEFRLIAEDAKDAKFKIKIRSSEIKKNIQKSLLFS